MKDRCCNPSNKDYPRYGGRGIIICKQWIDDYQQFLKDMGEPPDKEGYSIDRLDNDGPYSPGNCKWRTKKQQAQNRSPIEENAKSESTLPDYLQRQREVLVEGMKLQPGKN